MLTDSNSLKWENNLKLLHDYLRNAEGHIPSIVGIVSISGSRMQARPSLVPRPLPDYCEIKSGSGLGTRLSQAYFLRD